MGAYNIQRSKWILEDGSIDPEDIHRKIENFIKGRDRLFIATFLELDAIVVNPIESVPEFDIGQ